VLHGRSNGEPVAFCITVPDMNQALRAAGGHMTRSAFGLGFEILWATRKIRSRAGTDVRHQPGFAGGASMH